MNIAIMADIHGNHRCTKPSVVPTTWGEPTGQVVRLPVHEYLK